MQTDSGEAIEKGQWWYVRYPAENELVMVKVLDATEMTVLVDPVSTTKKQGRYKNGYLEFVELTQP
jgi:hypothetical protein